MSPSIESRRVSFVGSEGRLLAGIIDQPVGSSHGSILLAHCFTCSKDLKAGVRIARGLAAHGWTTMRFDFAGIGMSQGDFAQTNFRSNRVDLLAAAHCLEAEASSPCLLFGHSFGGAAAISIANELESLRGVVTLASPSDTKHLADLLARMNPEIERIGHGTVSIGGRAFPIAKQMLEDFRSYDLTLDLTRLNKPLVIFHSPADQTVGYHHALRIYALVQQASATNQQRPEVSLFTLPKSDHLLVDHRSDVPLVVDLTHAWLKRLVVAS